MTEQITDTAAQGSQEDDGTEQVPSTGTGTTAAADESVIEQYRKRQAGADAARAVAERELAEARKKLEAYQAAEREQSDAKLTEEAKLQQRLADAERRAQEAERAAEAKVLDRLYPKARAEYPEVRDEARLAKLEALLSDDAPEPPAEQARSMRASKTAGVVPPPQTSKDIFASLKGKRWSDIYPD